MQLVPSGRRLDAVGWKALETTCTLNVRCRARILGYLKRQRVITVDSEADVLSVSDELAERDPALAQLAAAAVSGLAPAGPELRRRPVEMAFDGRPEW
jgi:hypothetical protein